MSSKDAIAYRRLKGEYKQLTVNPPEGMTAGPLDEDNMFEWECLILGAEDTLYEGGCFRALLSFPKDEQSLKSPYSEDTARMIDEEVRLRVDTAYKRTLALVKEKKHLVEAMAQGLLDKEVLQRHDLVKLLGDRPFVSENPQNIDILNEGFKMHYPKTATAPEDEPADTDEPEDDEPSPAFPLAT